MQEALLYNNNHHLKQVRVITLFISEPGISYRIGFSDWKRAEQYRENPKLQPSIAPCSTFYHQQLSAFIAHCVSAEVKLTLTKAKKVQFS